MNRTAIELATGLLAAAAISCACAGCGGNAVLPPTRDRTLAGLSTVEKQRFCDEFNGIVGGYGAQLTCPDGSTPGADSSQASCVSAVQKLGMVCPALTVGDVDDCFGVLCDAATAVVCGPLRVCLPLVTP